LYVFSNENLFHGLYVSLIKYNHLKRFRWGSGSIPI